jgi:hypothetical protein
LHCGQARGCKAWLGRCLQQDRNCLIPRIYPMYCFPCTTPTPEIYLLQYIRIAGKSCRQAGHSLASGQARENMQELHVCLANFWVTSDRILLLYLTSSSTGRTRWSGEICNVFTALSLPIFFLLPTLCAL